MVYCMAVSNSSRPTMTNAFILMISVNVKLPFILVCILVCILFHLVCCFILHVCLVSSCMCVCMYVFLYSIVSFIVFHVIFPATIVKPVISSHSNIKVLMANDSLMKVQSIAECSPWSILQCF